MNAVDLTPSLDRTLAILAKFREVNEPQRLTEVAAQLRNPPTCASPIARALVAQGVPERQGSRPSGCDLNARNS